TDGCSRNAALARQDGGMSERTGVPGMRLAKGLAVTLKTMTRRAHTRQYPDVEPDLPPRSRGVIALLEENCTVCMLCARECPDWCIYIDSHKEEVVVPGAARPRQRNVLDRFDIDFALCMYCGICIEACPFDALYWTPEFEYSELDVLDLLHDKERPRAARAAPRQARETRDGTAYPLPRRTGGAGHHAGDTDVTVADALLLALGVIAVGSGALVVTSTHL